jgi:uncharacterized protein (DUF1499 family)
MKTRKALATGLAGMGLGYALWRGWATGVEKAWTKVFGPHDLGPVDFDTLDRRARSRDALASAKAVSPRASPDFEPPVYRIDPDRLRAIVAEFAASEDDTIQVFADTGIRQDRFVTRTRLLRFPSTLDVRILDLGEGRATLAIYARSPRRGSDLGANRKRVKRWIDHITERVSKETLEADS